MKTVIFGIGHLKKLYWDDIDIVFFDESGWWIKNLKDNERKFININSFNLELGGLSKKDTSGIVSELIEWLPIWSRWVGKGDQYELLIREAYLQVLYIMEGLKQLKIQNAIFQTAISHHIPTVIFERACVHVGICPIFTYLEPITERYVLMKHIDGVKDRKILTYKISNFQAHKYVNQFIENKIEKGIPKSHGVTLKRYSSFSFGIAYLVIRKNLSRLKQFIFNKSSIENISKKFFVLYPFQEFFQMYQQYKATRFYKQNITQNANLIQSSNRIPKLLIAAHRQPEATSFPEGWGMSNHIDVVIELRRLGYKDEIVYKEHFTSFWYTIPILGTTRVGMYRSINYFKDLLELGCKFIDVDYKLSLDNNENNWYLPVTITGTIALERSLAGYHTIVMGYPWFKGLPGLIYIDDIKSLDSIKDEWLVQNPIIATEAKEFMSTLLSEHSLTNIHDMKNGDIAKVTQDDLISFKKEFDAFLKYLNMEN